MWNSLPSDVITSRNTKLFNEHFVGWQAIVRRYKILLNIKIIYSISITLYLSFRFGYRLVFVVFY